VRIDVRILPRIEGITGFQLRRVVGVDGAVETGEGRSVER
jgi:hypothetical protein